MSLTGRPRSPPLALTSSSQIFWASSADLPLGASPPDSAMLKPILIGSPDCAQAAPANTSVHAASTANARARQLLARHVASCSIVILPLNVQISRFRFFMGEPRSWWCSDGQFEALAEGSA